MTKTVTSLKMKTMHDIGPIEKTQICSKKPSDLALALAKEYEKRHHLALSADMRFLSGRKSGRLVFRVL